MTCLDRLQTKDKLLKWGMVADDVCSPCNQESWEHLFFNCPVSKAVWRQVMNWNLIDRVPMGWNEEVQWAIQHLKGISFINRKSFADRIGWVKKLKETKDEQELRLTFLSEFVAAFRDQIHTDILVKPGNSERPIHTHRALLAVRSNILKNMLDSDRCKAPPSSTLTFPELNHEELDSLMEFLYSGHLPEEKLEKHDWSLLIAADKYEIPFLQKLCENHILGSLNSSNAFDILERSDAYSSLCLKKAALSIIVKDGKKIAFSDRFEEIAVKSPRLSVEITRALLTSIPEKPI